MEDDSEAEAPLDEETASEINPENELALESEVPESSELIQESEPSSFDVGDLFEDVEEVSNDVRRRL